MRAHEEAFKAIEHLKRRLKWLQVFERNNRTAAETVQAKLTTSQNRSSQQMQALDREIADLTSRCGVS